MRRGRFRVRRRHPRVRRHRPRVWCMVDTFLAHDIIGQNSVLPRRWRRRQHCIPLFWGDISPFFDTF